MRELDHIGLGASLFIPASHKAVEDILLRNKYPQLRSLVIDFEDGFNLELFEESLRSVSCILEKYEYTSFALFLRPRDASMLEQFLACENIDKVDGFVLPKCSLISVDRYLKTLSSTSHYFMPSIEGEELFDEKKLKELRGKLLPYKKHILTVRFGLEDMLKALGMRRSCAQSAFDISVCSFVIARLIYTFKPYGFNLSGGVYPCYENKDGFMHDIQRDLHEGLFGKTIIHPNQIAWSNEAYAVTREELEDAQKITNSSANVFSLNGKMGEKITMHSHAVSVLQRHAIYGLKEF